MSVDVLGEFKSRMHEIKDLAGVLGLLTWDQETYMPEKAGPARGQQLSTMQGLYHERLSDPRLGEVLAALESKADLDPATRAMVRNLAWERGRAVKVPPQLVKELAERQAHAVEAWRNARERNDFAAFRPHLETLVRLRREQADALGHDGERYDALLESYEPGMRAARLEPLFEALRGELVPLVRAIGESGTKPDTSFLERRFDPEGQWAFTMQLLADMGFDLAAGRQDRSIHPFTGGTHPNDVRLTTRIFPENLLSGVMSTIHEAGHGLYEQGFDPAHHRTTLAQAPSMGLHESQSRFWENLIGRSRPFWQHYLPRLKQQFPGVIDEIDLDQFHAAVNCVAPTLIRVEADEVTYNLHILVRFELELALLRGQLEVKDLPEAWNARMEAFLGIRPPDDKLGVMQDIHWAWGEFGYFPTYTLGNLYAAMLCARLEQDLPSLWEDVARGELKPILGWLREQVHRKGFLMSAEDLVESITGSRLSERPFVDRLWSKYGPLYGVTRG